MTVIIHGQQFCSYSIFNRLNTKEDPQCFILKSCDTFHSGRIHQSRKSHAVADTLYKWAISHV